MSKYVPADGVYIGRPPCANCGSNFHLHYPPEGFGSPGMRLTRTGLGALYDRGVDLSCPQAYRPDSLDSARDELRRAEASGDPARVFVARGNLQRLEGKR